MSLKRYVKIEKVTFINYGKDYRKLSVIVNVIDQNRAPIETPEMVMGKEGYPKKIDAVVMMRIFARKIRSKKKAHWKFTGEGKVECRNDRVTSLVDIGLVI
ncbi:uncharacterized protein LOC131180659 [Hevea brasiliensis]|uniref:uncharacterized protein LOC131180659 n=1 Tax=Hevea brasiliensis TaxID=3981 RepID=UPI0025FED3AD|nr:uncharacterized protein LOC131180659 [Hevea brasiliensis]